MTLRNISLWSTLLILGGRASGQVVEFTDFASWEAAVGDYVTLDFTGFAPGTTLTDQYQEEFGALLTNDDFIDGPQCFTYPNDCFGLDGAANDIMIEFDQPYSMDCCRFSGFARLPTTQRGQRVLRKQRFWSRRRGGKFRRPRIFQAV